MKEMLCRCAEKEDWGAQEHRNNIEPPSNKKMKWQDDHHTASQMSIRYSNLLVAKIIDYIMKKKHFIYICIFCTYITPYDTFPLSGCWDLGFFQFMNRHFSTYFKSPQNEIQLTVSEHVTRLSEYSLISVSFSCCHFTEDEGGNWW